MSTCRRQGGTGRRQTASAPTVSTPAASAASSGPAAGKEPAVRRYVHPIRTARPAHRDPAEAMLSQILAGLERQSALLEELLRRTEGNKPDTN